MNLIISAQEMAERMLASALPRRWTHVQAVAAKAASAAVLVPDEDKDVLVASAWLHDVGYSPAIAEMGFHQLDGARWLRGRGVSRRLAALVAHHSCAAVEAGVRGFRETLEAEFAQERTTTADVLWWADMTTGPSGQDLTVEERLDEIRARYGAEHAVSKTWVLAGPTIIEVVHRVEARLATHLAVSLPRSPQRLV